MSTLFGGKRRRGALGGVKPKRVVSEAQQALMFSRRALVVGGLQAGLGLVLAGRMGWLAIAENERYSLLSESNRVNLVLTPPRRGWIVDRHGKPIAINRTDFRVDLIPDRVEDGPATVKALGDLLGLPIDERERILEELKTAAGFQPVEVAAGLDFEQYAAVNLQLADVPGIAPASGFSRYYPEGAAVGHLVGYVGVASAKDYEEDKNPLLITPGFKVGKDGVEKVLETRMRGTPGARRSEVTARGKLVRDLETRSDVPGGNVRLTVDAGLQAYAARRLGVQSGSVVVIDTLTGDILAMASMPSYDPNSFSDGIGRMEYAMLREDERIPLMNKSLQGLYPPGSTMKPVTSLAALAGGVDPDDTVSCGGGYVLGNRRFACLGRHGPMTMRRAIAKSCNTYFYTVGRRVGIELIASTAKTLGLGQEFDLPLPSQRYGTVPSTAWKAERYRKNPKTFMRPDWTQADTLNTSIGQGFLQLNPLQLAVMSARIASGRMLEPSLIARREVNPGPLPFPAEHLQVVREGMDEVVNGAGTAGRSKLPLEGIAMGGKTGTAQVRRIGAGGGRGGVGTAWKYRDHGLFVAFAPVANPRYAASVVIEHGMSGSGAAAPVASDCLLYLFDREKALAKLAELEQGWGGDIATRMAAQSAAYARARAGGADAEAAAAQADATSAGAQANARAAVASEAANAAAEARD